MSQTSQSITPELRAWIVEQASAGHSSDSVLEAMKASGWHEDTALVAMEEVMLAHVGQINAPAHEGSFPTAGLPMIETAAGNTLWAYDRAIRVLASLAHPRLVVLANVVSDEECATLMASASERLDRSQTVVHETGGSEVNVARTSDGMFFSRGETEVIERIEKRLAALTQWPIENGEGLQILRYLPGAEYKPHFDYFDPAQPGTAAVLRRGGQRLATLVIYLNAPERGGATIFPDAGVSVHPVAGHAVFFSYALPDPTTKTLHGGAPVEAGEKWVATKWMRAGRFE